MEKKKLCRSTTDKKICGVCGGLAEYFGIDSTIVRVIVVVLVLCCGVGLLPYIICAIILPKASNVTMPEAPNTSVNDNVYTEVTLEDVSSEAIFENVPEEKE